MIPRKKGVYFLFIHQQQLIDYNRKTSHTRRASIRNDIVQLLFLLLFLSSVLGFVVSLPNTKTRSISRTTLLQLPPPRPTIQTSSSSSSLSLSSTTALHHQLHLQLQRTAKVPMTTLLFMSSLTSTTSPSPSPSSLHEMQTLQSETLVGLLTVSNVLDDIIKMTTSPATFPNAKTTTKPHDTPKNNDNDEEDTGFGIGDNDGDEKIVSHPSTEDGDDDLIVIVLQESISVLDHFLERYQSSYSKRPTTTSTTATDSATTTDFININTNKKSSVVPLPSSSTSSSSSRKRTVSGTVVSNDSNDNDNTAAGMNENNDNDHDDDNAYDIVNNSNPNGKSQNDDDDDSWSTSSSSSLTSSLLPMLCRRVGQVSYVLSRLSSSSSDEDNNNDNNNNNNSSNDKPVSNGNHHDISSSIGNSNSKKNRNQKQTKKKNKKQVWQQLQEAAQLLQYPVVALVPSPSPPSSTTSAATTSSAVTKSKQQQQQQQQQVLPKDSLPRLSNALVVSLVFGALALGNNYDGENNNNDKNKAAASALSSTVSRNKPLRLQGQRIARTILRSYLIHATNQQYMDGTTTTATTTTKTTKTPRKRSNNNSLQFNLQVLNHFAKAFKIEGANHRSSISTGIEPHISAGAIEATLRSVGMMKSQTSDDDVGGGDGNKESGKEDSNYDASTVDATTTSDNNYDSKNMDIVKQKLSGALALACQLQPWSVLTPLDLVESAMSCSLWHAAEEICHSAYKAARAKSSSSSTNTTSSISTSDEEDDVISIEDQTYNVELAVLCLIDSAMEDRTYRRADSFATNLYDAGGKTRYVEARYMHACDTIAKVVKKRQIPIVDRQIERVDKAVEKVSSTIDNKHSPGENTDTKRIQSIDDSGSIDVPVESSSTESAFSYSDEIRQFALRRIEESGDLAAAKRLAALHGIDYVYDERAIMLAAAMRKRRYLQYEDVLSGEIPPLIDDPKTLRLAYEEIRIGPYGFDAEWDEETTGASILQLATMEQVLLIDMLALTSTKEGVSALRDTCGQIFAGGTEVVGFACRQDMSRLRATFRGESEDHWLSLGAKAVVDVQSVIGETDRSLLKAGLSRCCEALLGKPLDKSEQCSMWSFRPLSENQRSYAALDAWACIAMWKKLQVKRK